VAQSSGALQAFVAKNREAFKVRQHRALASLPSRVASIIGEMTEHITSLSTILRDAGFLDKNLMATLTENLGIYLHRSYEIFDNPKFAEQIRKNTTVMQAAASLVRRQIESRNAAELMRQVAEEGGIMGRGQAFIIDISTRFPTLARKQPASARAKSMRILWIKECCQKARWG